MQFPDELWKTSSYTGTGGQCVEVAMSTDMVGMRDTKNRTAGHVTMPASAFAKFIDAVKHSDGWRNA